MGRETAAKLIGNERVFATLAAWTRGGRLPHCVLIEGEPGTGRRSLANFLAAAILCSGGQQDRPCGLCKNCVKVRKGVHPDLTVLQGGGGARSFHIDTVRGMRADAFVRPNEAEARVFLLLESQNMSPQAQNALLKIIEEPPPGVHFLLVCENRESMLPTILSRAAALTMQAPGVKACAEHLALIRPDALPERIQAVSEAAAGNIGRALSLLDDESAEAAFAAGRDTLYAILRGDEISALAALAALERDRDGFAARLAMIRAAAQGLLPGSPPAAGAPALTPARAARTIDLINEAHTAARMNGNLSLLGTWLCAGIRQAATE